MLICDIVIGNQSFTVFTIVEHSVALLRQILQLVSHRANVLLFKVVEGGQAIEIRVLYHDIVE